jgi:restriction system protein
MALQEIRVSVVGDAGQRGDVEFEAYVAELFRREGWRASLTSHSGDEGIDIDLVRTADGKRAVAQCKRWKGNVGQPVVRDLYGAMMHAGVDEAYLITTSGFTAAAVSFSRGKPLHLVGGSDLQAWAKRCGSGEFSSPQSRELPPEHGGESVSPVEEPGSQAPSTLLQDSTGDESEPGHPQSIAFHQTMQAWLGDLLVLVRDQKVELGGMHDDPGVCISTADGMAQLAERHVRQFNVSLDRIGRAINAGFSRCNAQPDAEHVRGSLAEIEHAVRAMISGSWEVHTTRTALPQLGPVLSALQETTVALLEDLEEVFTRVESANRRFLESPQTALQRGVVERIPDGGYGFSETFRSDLPRCTEALERVGELLKHGATGIASGCLLALLAPCVLLVALLLAIGNLP